MKINLNGGRLDDFYSIEDRIISVLQTSGALSMTELVVKVQEQQASVKPAEVKAAVLPLIMSNRIDFTSERKLLLLE